MILPGYLKLEDQTLAPGVSGMPTAPRNEVWRWKRAQCNRSDFINGDGHNTQDKFNSRGHNEIALSSILPHKSNLCQFCNEVRRGTWKRPDWWWYFWLSDIAYPNLTPEMELKCFPWKLKTYPSYIKNWQSVRLEEAATEGSRWIHYISMIPYHEDLSMMQQ